MKFADMLGEMRVGFATLDGKIAALGGRIDAQGGRIDALGARLDGRIDALGGRVDAQGARLEGRIDALSGRMDGFGARIDALERATAGIKPTIIFTGLAVAALIVGVLTYGQTWFGIGVSTRDIVRATVTEYVQQHPEPAIRPTPEAK